MKTYQNFLMLISVKVRWKPNIIRNKNSFNAYLNNDLCVVIATLNKPASPVSINNTGLNGNITLQDAATLLITSYSRNY